ncbi:hypothetical protein NQ318_020958 [Aromia moschata]|uniref:Reverse transcriptase zinc-binding domain-containing protein n=1 Tax=Aromia moschata TaxID=1265417 RepID=A0AAV8YMZ9_9CUCU|nr:hypothetical protein NQ318_020958 [Aromia moschata]
MTAIVYFTNCDSHVSNVDITEKLMATDHCHLKRHLHMIRVIDDPECGWCMEDEETASHILTDCPAIARVRERHFGSCVLNPEDVKSIHPRKICAFAREVGIHG